MASRVVKALPARVLYFSFSDFEHICPVDPGSLALTLVTKPYSCLVHSNDKCIPVYFDLSVNWLGKFHLGTLREVGVKSERPRGINLLLFYPAEAAMSTIHSALGVGTTARNVFPEVRKSLNQGGYPSSIHCLNIL